MIDLERMESIARAFDGGLGDAALLDVVRRARQGDNEAHGQLTAHIERIKEMPADPDRTVNLRARRPSPSIIETQNRRHGKAPVVAPRRLTGDEPWEIIVMMRQNPTRVDMYDQIALAQWLIEHSNAFGR